MADGVVSAEMGSLIYHIKKTYLRKWVVKFFMGQLKVLEQIDVNISMQHK